MANDQHIEILADRVDRMACSKCGHHMDLTGLPAFSEFRCPQCGAQQSVPLRLGSFLLLKELGKGGMGAVYRAFDETLGRYVAIKVMQRSLADDKTFAENFLKEARAAAALNHTHVAQIYSCGQEKGQLYIVMELVDGGRLDEMMAGGKALDEVFALELAVEVAQGLMAAGEIGMVHGDIKPANILFDRQNRAKVVDFGLARFANRQHAPGEIWGTPYYIAPEKVRSQPEDQRSDIYSLGATLYHVLSGKPPFDGETAKDVVVARLKAPADNLRLARPAIQPETADVIARMLESEPSMRYPTYKSLLADLQEALKVARQNRGMPASPDKTSRTPLVIGVLIVLFLFGGLYLFFSGDDTVDTDRVPPGPTPVEKQAGKGTAAAPPEVKSEPDIVYAVQPFEGDTETALMAAIQQWVDGHTGAMEVSMAKFYNGQPRTGVERPWAGVLLALPAWIDQRYPDMLRYLRGIQDAQLREREGDQLHPGAMPQVLARFMVGTAQEADMRKVADDWPPWFGHLIDFFVGARQLQEGNIDAASKSLTQYVAAKATEAAHWPYAMQPIARGWLDDIAGWEKLRGEAHDATPKTAIKRLRTYRTKAPVFIHKQIDAEIKAAEARQRAEDERQQAELRAAQQALVAEDMEQVEALRTELAPLVLKREFRRGASSARAVSATLKTEEGKAALGFLVERYERMESLRRFLIQGIVQNPFKQNVAPELGGDAINATHSGIRIALGGYGSTIKSWDQVSERTFVSLAEYYLATVDMPDKDRADLLLSLAVFCYEHRGFRLAQTYVDKAAELDSDLATTTTKQLMPDLVK